MPNNELSVSGEDVSRLTGRSFESADLSFEKVGELFGETFMDAIAALSPTNDIDEAVQNIRDLADNYHVDLADALLGATVASNADADSAIAAVGFRDLLTADEIAAPNELVFDEALDDILHDDRLNDTFRAIASIAPDSLCAQITGFLDQREDIFEKRMEAEDHHIEILAAADENGDYEAILAEQKAYTGVQESFDILDSQLNEAIDQFYDKLSEIRGVSISVEEQDVISKILDADERGDYVNGGMFLDTAKDYIAQHPDSILTDFCAAREEYMAVREYITYDSPFEVKQDLANKYNAYNRVCRDAMHAQVVETPERVSDTVEAQKNDEIGLEGNEQAGVEKANIIDADVTVSDSGQQREIAAEDAAQKTDSSAVEAPGTEKDLPNGYDIRVDARSIVDYCVAERIHANGKGYLSFNEGKDLVASVHAKFDDMERMAKAGYPMAKEFSDIVNELDALGPATNSDFDHDNRIEELIARKSELTDYAGAVIESTLNQTTIEQEKAINKYCQAEKLVERNPNSQTGIENMQFYKDELRRYSSPTSPDRGGVAAQFEDMLNVRDRAEAKVSVWLERYNSAPPDETEALSDALLEIRFARDKAQYAVDSRFYETQICIEGADRFGIIDLPPVVEEKQDIEAVPVTDTMQPTSDLEEKSPYEVAKERYEAVQGKYLFRNTFVCVERLNLNIEAYRAGENGANGHHVSGGDIAMNILELSRSNIFESIFEVAIRDYFDERFPERDSVDIGEDKVQLRWEDEIPTTRDFTREAADTGLVSDDFNPEHHHSDNPEFGHYMRADMTKAVKYNDIGINVYNCGPKDTIFTVTTGNVDKDGKSDVMAVPPLRLVTMGKSRFLVDPFGQTIRSNYVSDVRDADKNLEICHPYFDALDISASPQGRERLEAMAAHRHTDVETCKEEIVAQCKKEYGETGVIEIREHENYIKETLLPDTLSDLSECKERISFLSDVKQVFTNRVESPAGYDEPQDIENYKSVLKIIDDALGKLNTLETGFTTRVDQLASTIELYDHVKTVHRVSRDPDSKFETVVYATSRAHGKIDNPYFGVGLTDVQSIDMTLEACGFKTDNNLEDVFVGRGWPEESNTVFDWIGGKHDVIEPNSEIEELRHDIRESISVLVPNFEEIWPGLIDKGDRKFDIEKFDAKAILRDAGVVPVDKDAMIADAKKADVTENDHLERLGLYSYKHLTPAQDLEFMNSQPYVPTLEKAPTEAQIQRARDNIAHYAFGSPTAEGLGTRKLTADLDWNTVRPREIIQDGNRFWVRPEGEQKHILMTIDQTAAYLHGPLDKEDVSDALDKYLSISRDSRSTFSFATDFLDINKYRVSPETVLEAYSDKLHDFLSADGEKVDSYHVETMADCLASLKEQIVECYADKVSDKIEAIVKDAVSGEDSERVGTFVDKLAESFEPVVSKAVGREDGTGKVVLSDSVKAKLVSLVEKGAGPDDLKNIIEVAKAIDAVFEGYSDLLKDILETQNDVESKSDHVAMDDAAFVDEADDTEAINDVDTKDEADSSDSSDKDSFKDAVEDIGHSIQDVLDGLDRIDRYEDNGEKEVVPNLIDRSEDDDDKVDKG